MRFNSYADSTNVAYDMAISMAGHIHVTGSSIGWKSGNFDFMTVKYVPREAGRARLAIYNLRGELVRTLVGGEMAAGHPRVTFNARGLASGTYFYRLESGDFVSTRKMVLQK